MTYWRTRAKEYDKLAWVNNETLLKNLISFGNFFATDRVLDLGCGTGVLCRKLAPIVSEIIAVDSSREMLDSGKFPKSVIKLCVNIEKEDKIPHSYFNKIVSRMVFHHLENRDIMFDKCREMLVHGGSLIIEEGGVYDEPEIRLWYSRMMRLKEQRHNFTITELEKLFYENGFAKVWVQKHWNENFSVMNWLQHSGQPKHLCLKIWRLHKNAPQKVKEFYNMRETKDDIILRTNVVFIKGTKI